MDDGASELAHHRDDGLELLIGLESPARFVPGTYDGVLLNGPQRGEVEVLARSW